MTKGAKIEIEIANVDTLQEIADLLEDIAAEARHNRYEGITERGSSYAIWTVNRLIAGRAYHAETNQPV